MLPALVIEPCDRDWPGGVLGGHQPDERADGGAGEPGPVPDLDRQPEPGQGGDAAQATQPAHHRGVAGVGGHRLDRGVQPVPAVHGQRSSSRRRCRTASCRPGWSNRWRPQPACRGPRSTPSRRSRRCRCAAASSTPGAGPASDRRGRPPGPGPGPGPPPAPRSARPPRRSGPASNSRANSSASLASVFTRSPGGRCSFDGAATEHRTP